MHPIAMVFASGTTPIAGLSKLPALDGSELSLRDWEVEFAHEFLVDTNVSGGAWLQETALVAPMILHSRFFDAGGLDALETAIDRESAFPVEVGAPEPEALTSPLLDMPEAPVNGSVPSAPKGLEPAISAMRAASHEGGPIDEIFSVNERVARPEVSTASAPMVREPGQVRETKSEATLPAFVGPAPAPEKEVKFAQASHPFDVGQRPHRAIEPGAEGVKSPRAMPVANIAPMSEQSYSVGPAPLDSTVAASSPSVAPTPRVRQLADLAVPLHPPQSTPPVQTLIPQAAALDPGTPTAIIRQGSAPPPLVSPASNSDLAAREVSERPTAALSASAQKIPGELDAVIPDAIPPKLERKELAAVLPETIPPKLERKELDFAVRRSAAIEQNSPDRPKMSDNGLGVTTPGRIDNAPAQNFRATTQEVKPGLRPDVDPVARTAAPAGLELAKRTQELLTENSSRRDFAAPPSSASMMTTPYASGAVEPKMELVPLTPQKQLTRPGIVAQPIALNELATKDMAIWTESAEQGASTVPLTNAPGEVAGSKAHLIPQAQQIAVLETVSKAISEKKFPIEIALDPPELGSVRISIVSVENGVNLVIHADRPETQDLMRRHVAILHDAISDRLAGAEVNVSFSGSGGQQGSQTAQHQAFGTAPTGANLLDRADQASAQPVPTGVSLGQGRLNISL